MNYRKQNSALVSYEQNFECTMIKIEEKCYKKYYFG